MVNYLLEIKSFRPTGNGVEVRTVKKSPLIVPAGDESVQALALFKLRAAVDQEKKTEVIYDNNHGVC